MKRSRENIDDDCGGGEYGGAGGDKDKEKVEKRRALGRGLESLLPGPRVVAPGQTVALPADSRFPATPLGDDRLRRARRSLRIGCNAGRAASQGSFGRRWRQSAEECASRAGAPAATRPRRAALGGQPGAAVPTLHPRARFGCARDSRRDDYDLRAGRSRGCRGIWSSTWRLPISTRIRFRRGMSMMTRSWRSWRIRLRPMGWCSRSWCVRRTRRGATSWFWASGGCWLRRRRGRRTFRRWCGGFRCSRRRR